MRLAAGEPEQVDPGRPGASPPPRPAAAALAGRAGTWAATLPVWVPVLLGVAGLLLALGWNFLWWHPGFVDLRIYLGAAHNALLDRNPYDVPYPPINLDATYPPFALLLIGPLSLLPTTLVEVLWMLANFAVLTAVVSSTLAATAPLALFRTDRAWRWGTAALAVGLASQLLEPVRADFSFGQINILLLGLVALDVVRRPHRFRGAGIAVAAAVKLTPAFFGIVLLVERDWRAAVRCAATFLGLTACTWLLRPAASARYFFHFQRESAHIGPQAYVSNQSWTGILARMGLHGTAKGALWVLLAAAAVAALLVALRPLVGPPGPVSPAARPVAAMLTGFTTLLLAPISWTHHWVWVMLTPVVLCIPGLARSARVALAALTLLCIASPYWWAHDHHYVGTFTPFLNDTLALGGAAVLAWCAGVTLRRGSLLAAAPGAAVSSPQVAAGGTA